MLMSSVLNATEVRANFGGFIDGVVREKPRAVKRNRDVIFAMSKSHMREVLTAYEFTLEYEEDEKGLYVGSIEQISDIVGYGDTLDGLKNDLASQLIQYSEEYYEEYARYSNSPNRKGHANYIIRVLLEDSLDDVIRLFHA